MIVSSSFGWFAISDRMEGPEHFDGVDFRDLSSGSVTAHEGALLVCLRQDEDRVSLTIDVDGAPLDGPSSRVPLPTGELWVDEVDGVCSMDVHLEPGTYEVTSSWSEPSRSRSDPATLTLNFRRLTDFTTPQRDGPA